MPNVNVGDVSNSLEFYTLKGSLVQLVDNHLLYVDGELLPYITPEEAEDEYHFLLNSELDKYVDVREADHS